MTAQADHAAPDHSEHGGGLNPYIRFAGMIATSTIVMFILTYTNVFDVAHIHFSQERLYMAILMGSAMAMVMLGWMWKMHPDRRINVGIIAGALSSEWWRSCSRRRRPSCTTRTTCGR